MLAQHLYAANDGCVCVYLLFQFYHCAFFSGRFPRIYILIFSSICLRLIIFHFNKQKLKKTSECMSYVVNKYCIYYIVGLFKLKLLFCSCCVANALTVDLFSFLNYNIKNIPFLLNVFPVFCVLKNTIIRLLTIPMSNSLLDGCAQNKLCIVHKNLQKKRRKGMCKRNACKTESLRQIKWQKKKWNVKTRNEFGGETDRQNTKTKENKIVCEREWGWEWDAHYVFIIVIFSGLVKCPTVICAIYIYWTSKWR